MIEIQRATPHDATAILPLVEAYWRFEGLRGFESARVRAQLERLLGERALGAGWIARDAGAAAGYLLGVYVFSLEDLGLTAEIDELFVPPAHRGRGIGGELLGTAEAEFVRAGCTNVSLQLGRGNEAGRAFYRRHGYAEREGFELLDKTLRRA